MGVLCFVGSRCVSFIPPLLDHLLHHLQLTGVWCGSALKALKQRKTFSTTINEQKVYTYSIDAAGTQSNTIVATAHSAFCCGLVILLLCFGLLLELNDRHSVQVAVGPAIVHAVLQQVLFGK